MKTIFLTVMLVGSVVANAADNLTRNSHYIGFGLGQSTIILGSHERRTGGGISYGYGQPEPAFRLGSIHAQIVYQAYVDETRSLFDVPSQAFDTTAFGVLAGGLWRWPQSENKSSMYGEAGWGLQWATHATRDLPSKWNSTPYVGFGGAFEFGPKGEELFMGLRLLHISNGGTVHPNSGQNQLYLLFAFRY